MRQSNRSNRSKKGQAAFEFMSTHSWAMLMLMAALAALVYFMPNIRGITPEKCSIGPELTCQGARLTSAELTIQLKNALPTTVYNVSAQTTLPSVIDCDVSNTTIKAGQKIYITCKNSGAGGLELTRDSRIKININYKKVANGYDQLITGDIYAKIR